MNQNFNPQFSKIGDILINNGKVTDSGVNEALAHQKTTNDKIGVTLIEMGLIEEDDFGKLLWMRGRYGKSVDKSFYKKFTEIK